METFANKEMQDIHLSKSVFSDERVGSVIKNILSNGIILARVAVLV
jgi:hypothetical protein